MLKHRLPANLGKAAHIRLFPTYISNGHWAIAKSSLENGHIFTSEDSTKAYFPKRYVVTLDADDSAIQRINTSIGDVQLYTATPFLQDLQKEGIGRFFVNAMTGALAMFNCDYLDTFSLNTNDATLWGNNSKTCFRNTQKAEDMTLLLMPIAIDKGKLTVFQATLRALETQTV